MSLWKNNRIECYSKCRKVSLGFYTFSDNYQQRFFSCTSLPFHFMVSSSKFQNNEAAVAHLVNGDALRLSHGGVPLSWLWSSWTKHTAQLALEASTSPACLFLSDVTPNSILSSKKMLVAGHVLLLPLQSVFRSMQNNHLLPEMQREKKHDVILSLLLLTSVLVCTVALCKGA